MRNLLMSSLRRHRSQLLLAFLLVGAVGIYLWWNSRMEQSQDNPIHVAAARYGVEPALVKAVVWQESRFNPSVRGRAQELGLMQIREEAAQNGRTRSTSVGLSMRIVLIRKPIRWPERGT